MKAVIFYEMAPGKTREDAMALYPRHEAHLTPFITRKDILAVGPFADGLGSMGIFKDRAAAEAFVKDDPFVLEGIVGRHTIRDWNDNLLV
ncbi:MAG TPA: YciI family protein [bacterium]|nr:YciI family protein [bacterium]